MKKLTKIMAAMLAFITVFTIVILADSSSDSDPLVTLSYISGVLVPSVDEKIQKTVDDNNKEIEKLIDSKISALKEELKKDEPAAPALSENAEFEAISIAFGKTLKPKAACEVILRSGNARVVSPFENQGLSDLTAAKELYDGNSVSLNHLVLIPRADGRAIMAMSDVIWVMVRGEYEIV
ncbi:MAG: hypothetical protein J5922_01255 [Clostridia bacterium]|nr:hypothetical protein [Clostridia bacterium]